MNVPGDIVFPQQYWADIVRKRSGACDIGSGMFSEGQSSPDSNGLHLELLRLAIPRRVYTESHLRYVAESFSALREKIEEIPSFKCVNKPQFLGHFTAQYQPTAASAAIALA